jgi:nitrite reductase (NADH) small subunit
MAAPSPSAGTGGAADEAAPAAAAAANTWTPICRVEDIPTLGSRRVARERGLPVALFRTSEDKVFALLDRCPHKGGPLSQGIVAGEGVTCPLHGWTIGFEDGRVRAPDEGATPTFACRVDAGLVLLDAAELASHAIEFEAPVAGPCIRPVAGPCIRPVVPHT